MSEPAAPAVPVSEPAAPAPAAPVAEPATDPAAPPAAPAAPTDPAAPAVEAKPAGAPETYETFKLPEGVKFPEAITNDLQGLAREFNLPQEAAQKLADQNAKIVQGMRDEFFGFADKAKAEWVEQAKADKEIGGDSFAANVEAVDKAVVTFGGEEFKSFIAETGLNQHPAFIKTFLKIAKAISEDSLTNRTGANGARPGAPISERAPSAFGWDKSMTLNS